MQPAHIYSHGCQHSAWALARSKCAFKKACGLLSPLLLPTPVLIWQICRIDSDLERGLVVQPLVVVKRGGLLSENAKDLVDELCAGGTVLTVQSSGQYGGSSCITQLAYLYLSPARCATRRLSAARRPATCLCQGAAGGSPLRLQQRPTRWLLRLLELGLLLPRQRRRRPRSPCSINLQLCTRTTCT